MHAVSILYKNQKNIFYLYNTYISCRRVDRETVNDDIAMLRIQDETKLMLDKLYY